MRILFRLYIIFMIMVAAQPLLSSIDSKALLEQGIEAFKSGNFRSSELLFSKIIKSDSGEYRDRAWYYLALSIFHQKKYKSAIFELNRFLSICTTSELCSESRYWIAESHFALKENIKSIEEFKRFISISKNSVLIAAAYERIGRIYFIQKRFDEAIIEWEKALKVSKNNHQNEKLTLNIGEALFLDKKFDEAIHLLGPFMLYKVDKITSASARLILGRAYQIKSKHRKAIKIFNGIPSSLPVEAPFYNAHYYQALSFLALGNMNSARFHFESFILIGKESEWYYDAKLKLGEILINGKKESRGVKLLEEVRNSSKKVALKGRASIILSKIFFKRNPENAIAYLEDAVSLNNVAEKKEALFMLGRAYINVKRFKDAERVLGIIINDYSYDKEIDHARFLLAMVYLEQGDMNKAIEGFEKIREVNPFSKYINESYYYLALANKKNKDTQKAIELFNKYIKLKKPEKKYDAYIQLLNLFVEKGNIRKAKKIMGIIIKRYIRTPGVEDIIYSYGESLKNKGYPAERYFKIIVKKFPKSESAGKVYLTWGDESFVINEFRKAEWYYSQYLSVKGRNNTASVFLYRIISLYQLGKYEEVISIIDNKDLPSVDDYTSKQLSLWLARSHFRIENYDDSYNELLKWNLRDYIKTDLLIICKVSIRAGDLKTAKETSELLQEDKKLYSESLYELGLYYLEKKENDFAMGYFSRIIIECSLSPFVDHAKIEIADIFVKNKRYSEASQKLNEIKSKEIVDRKNAMLIIVNFKTGNFKKAVYLTKKYLKRLRKQSYGENVIKENLLYYFNNRKIKKFKKYSRYLTKYKGNDSFVNYLGGKLYFDIKKYKSSYFFFYKLAQAKSEHIEEALYYLGIISMFKQKNTKRAIRYFSKLAKINNAENEFSIKGKLNLAIILKEKGDYNKSKETLLEIMNGTKNVMFKARAEYLFEYYGYSR